MKLFRHNHPDYRFDQLQDFNLQILEFLVLFGATSSRKHSLSTETLESLNNRYDQHLRFRRTWIDRRAESHPAEFEDVPPWWRWQPKESRRSADDPLNDYSPRRADVSQLLQKFLALSAAAAGLRGEAPNEYWMDLAAEFMLQSAVQRLRAPRRRPGVDLGDYVDDEEKCADDPDADSEDDDAVDIIIRCFAYGVVSSYRHQETSEPGYSAQANFAAPAWNRIIENRNRKFDQDDLERRLSRLFCAEQEGNDSPGSRSDDDDGDDNGDQNDKQYNNAPTMAIDPSVPPEPTESPTWTRTRLRYLSLFLPKPGSPDIHDLHHDEGSEEADSSDENQYNDSEEDDSPDNAHLHQPEDHASYDMARTHPLPRLRQKFRPEDHVISDVARAHPLPRFRQKVLRFVESLWRDLGSGNNERRPLLVSVECGDSEGLGLERKEDLQGMLRRARVCG